MLVTEEMVHQEDIQLGMVGKAVTEEMGEAGAMEAAVETVATAGPVGVAEEMAAMEDRNGRKAFFQSLIFDFGYNHVDLVGKYSC